MTNAQALASLKLASIATSYDATTKRFLGTWQDECGIECHASGKSWVQLHVACVGSLTEAIDHAAARLGKLVK